MPKGGRFLKRPEFLKSLRTFDDPGAASGSFYFPGEQPTTPQEEGPDLRDLNNALQALTDIFPDVQPEVFREMLLSLGEESRLAVVTEHLLRDKAKFVQGRFRAAKKSDTEARPTPAAKGKTGGLAHPQDPDLAVDDTFRSEEYKQAVKATCYLEFRTLNHSSIKAVLAECNYSYTLARPVLQQLSSKTWRAAFSNLWSRKRSATSEADNHPSIVWQSDLSGSGLMLPCLKRTASPELDKEVYNLIIAPVLARQREEQYQADVVIANHLNEAEAEQAEALYDCECCYTPSVFEQISSCNDGCHYICFRCIRHAVKESLFGQGWARNIDAERLSVRCLAPTNDDCHGCIPTELVQRALMEEKDGEHQWKKLEDRVAAEALLKSQLPLLRCPFCSYAELDELPDVQYKTLDKFTTHVVRLSPTPLTALLAALFSPLLYLLLDYVLLPLLALFAILQLPIRSNMIGSRKRIAHRRRGLKFICRNPSCSQRSCINCSLAWRDPHTCHESSILSLRHAIETATTSSIKRTCPKCNLSFVKSSGCNKLVCNCGYTMCYVCRTEIGKEGYGHFCQHFRERGGRCIECDRCDLYVVEDEEGVIRRAAQRAEKEWLEREGKAAKGVVAALDNKEKYGNVAAEVIAGKKGAGAWNLDDWLDAIFDAALV